MAHEAAELINECRKRAGALPSKRSFEWLGRGHGLNTLVNASELGDWDAEKGFWANEALLAKTQGIISRINDGGSGEIELEMGLKAFFVPSRGLVEGGYWRGRDEGQRVEFYLGFSYEGLRAWSVDDVEIV